MTVGTALVSPLSVVADTVEFGAGCVVEEFCLVGRHTGRTSDGTVRPTVIGAGSTLRSHTVVYAGSRIGARFQTGHHVLVRENNTIGDDVSIGSLSVVEHTVTIGDKVRIHSQNFIPEFTVLEEGAWIGPRVTVTNHPFPECPEPAGCMVGLTQLQNLSSLPPVGAVLIAAPLPIVRGSGSPCRVLALVER
jgi:UDP-3-O-[3-hydroxymyristoyl] glucosamine N-acyltransferase